jgi:hypothetical protein
LRKKWKTYVLYKTKDVDYVNQRLAVVVSRCGKMFFIMKNFAASHHFVIPHCGTLISRAKLTRFEGWLRAPQSPTAPARHGPSHMIRALSPPQDGQGADASAGVTP